MNSNKDKINQIPIIDVLSKLGYNEKTHYKIMGNNIRMFDNKGKISDGWIGSISENRLFCKSGVKDGRFEGDIIGIIKGALNMEAGDAIEWAENTFNIDKGVFTSKQKTSSLGVKFSSLPELNQEQRLFLSERGIEYNEHIKRIAKNNNGVICSTIQSEGGLVKAIQGRKIGDTDKKFRYQIEKDGEDGSGIFKYIFNQEKKVCFVVEGMTDFYTLAQFGVNVIGLISATAGIQYLKAFHKKYKLIYIPDNDEAGIKSVEALEEKGIEFGKFFLSSIDEKLNDLNDAWNMMQKIGMDGFSFIKEIYEQCEKPPTNIGLALKDALSKSKEGFKTGEKTFDWATGGIVPGTTYLINGPSSQGKTTWSMWILMKLLKQKVKIGFFSMETRPGKMLAQILGYYYGKNWKKEVMPNIEKYLNEYGIDNLDNLFLFNDIKTLDLISETIEKENLQVVFIDYAQLVRGLPGKAMKEKMDEYAWRIQQIAQDTECATITLSQVSKSESQSVPVLYRTPKEAGALMEASDTMINVGRFNGKHKVGFVKCKEGDDDAWNTEHDTDWDKNTGEIKIFADFDTLGDGKM